MSDYTPPDALKVFLNFTKEIKPIDSHNLVLNFGAEDGFSYANISVDTSFKLTATGTVEPPIDIHGFANIQIDTGFVFKAVGTFDINHIVGVSFNSEFRHQKALHFLEIVRATWSKPNRRALNEVVFYDAGLTQLNVTNIRSEQSGFLAQYTRSFFDETMRLKSDLNLDWQENLQLKNTRSFKYEIVEKLSIKRHFDWVELIRKRKQVKYSHEVASYFQKRYQLEWDKGLELVTTCNFAWDKAKPVHYRMHSITPWPEPEKPQFIGNTDFNFVCACTEFDAHNLILNFGVDDCIPSIVNKNWWHIVNEVSIVNTRTNEEIKVLNGSYNTDRSRWCWSYSLTVTEPEMTKLEKGDVLKINVNGNVHMMMYEEYSKSQKFADTTYNLTGRSQTALLESKYSPVRSYLQENERTSVQLVQAELDRVNSETALNWQLIDDLGWIVETESLSYTNLAPIDAIKLIAEAGGGFVYSEKGSNTLSIRPLYKKTFWDTLNLDDYDRNLPESIVIQHGDSFDELLNFNAITLTNPRNGNVGQIRRRNTAGDILLEPVSNPLFNAVSMGGFGKSKLAKSGKVESHDFDFPIILEVGECIPGEILAFNGEWWGIVDAVSVSFTYSVVSQSIKVERTVNE